MQHGFYAILFVTGGSVLLLLEFERNLTDFMKNHNIVTSLGQGSFDETTITWHNSYRIILVGDFV